MKIPQKRDETRGLRPWSASRTPIGLRIVELQETTSLTALGLQNPKDLQKTTDNLVPSGELT